MSASRRLSDLLRVCLTVVAIAGYSATGAAAQGGEAGVPIVVVDQERLFDDSLFGRRILGEIDERSEELAAENREIEATLIAEERALTERRGTMTQEAFREQATAFDARVTRLRAEQDAKLRAVSRLREEARQDFYGRVTPIMQRILEERDALVLIERRAVLSATEAADITDLAISRIDEEIGDGTGSGPAAAD